MATAALGATKETQIVLPGNGVKIWDHGMKERWCFLGDWLKRSAVESIWVTDLGRERHLEQYRTLIDSSSPDHWTLVGTFFFSGDDDGASKWLKRVLALGANPCGTAGEREHALHKAVEIWQPKCAEALILCGADIKRKMAYLSVTMPLSVTMLRFVQDKEACGCAGASNLRQLLERVYQKGYPMIAELAYERKFWAVQNRCRRLAVSHSEAVIKFNGKNAVEWAEEYGEHGLANELRYYLEKSRVLEATVTATKKGSSKKQQPAPPAQPQEAGKASCPVKCTNELKGVQKVVSALSSKIDSQTKAIRSELQAEKAKSGNMKGEVNNLRQAQLAQEIKCKKMQASLDAMEPRLKALEDVKNDDTRAGQAGFNRAGRRTGAEDPVCAVIFNLLDQVAEIAPAGSSLELLEDLVKLVKKHKPTAASTTN